MSLRTLRYGLLQTTSHLAIANYFYCVRKYPKSWDELQGTNEVRVGTWS
jgi:hypothetical protein